jgi:hypothetical protein
MRTHSLNRDNASKSSIVESNISYNESATNLKSLINSNPKKTIQSKVSPFRDKISQK